MPPKPGSKGAEVQQARNELFAGAEQPINIDSTQIPVENQTVQQLVNTAVTTHKETTATAQRALKVIEETKQVQAATMKSLQEQGKKMDEIDTAMREMNEELTYAERLLSYMRRCCFCWLCDSCTGADPEEKKKRDWNRRVDAGQTQGRPGPPGLSSGVTMVRGKAGAAAAGAGGSTGPLAGMKDPDIRLPTEHRTAEMGLHEETRKQNETIDQIHQGLDQLLEGAKNMTDELSAQGARVDRLNNKAEFVHDRINDMNKNSQLRNFAGATK